MYVFNVDKPRWAKQDILDQQSELAATINLTQLQEVTTGTHTHTAYPLPHRPLYGDDVALRLVC